ncbi:MAG: hypothetical protein R2798_01155 [Chitinophagales bacterium]|nr:hypothetical protein [Bacteroidota bacterium]MCB9042989.1 hypothetical protein [Chitinophagales bacterium]
MPFSNLIEMHFSEAEKAQVNESIRSILEIVARYSHNLSPEERTKYGSIHEKNKLFVEKVISYHKTQPHLSSNDVQWEEMLQDWSDRQFLEELVRMLREVSEQANDARILHDYDLYNNALTDYDYVKYKRQTDRGGGFDTKYNDLRQFMPKGNTAPRTEGDGTSEPAPDTAESTDGAI